jgi:hypothetical protein
MTNRHHRKLAGICAAGVVVFALICGCKESIQQRVDDAKSGAQKEQASIDRKEREAQFDYLDEWTDFRVEAEKQVLVNANSIDALRTKIAAASSGPNAKQDSTTLEALALTNRSLLAKLDQYKDEGKVGWDVFKRDFSVESTNLQRTLKQIAMLYG